MVHGGRSFAMRRLLCLCPLLFAPVYAADPLPGHSFHGEAFDEGPRQAAVLIDGCGKVNFAVTTKSAEAQRFFNQGVGQLHGFWYFEAERSFRQVAMIDPECAMAYWGCAMANVNNEKRATDFIKKASDLKSKASKREQMWIDALAEYYRDTKREKKSREMDFIKAAEDIIHDNPEDIEAKAFLAWAIWHAKDGGVPMVSRETVDAVISQVFAKEPMHPAHHYRIHLWDDSKPVRAVASAAQCGQAAPGIAHMWHMPGHTFSKVNRLDDAEWQQEAATRVDHAYMIRTEILPDQIHNYAHNTEWLIRTLQQLGRAHEAVTLAKNLIEIPRHPKFNPIDRGDKSAGFGRTRLLETMLKFEMWDDLLALDGSAWFDTTQNPSIEAARMRALGIAAFFKGDEVRLQNQLAALDGLKSNAKPKKADPQNKNADASKNPRTEKGATTPESAVAELKVLAAILKGSTTDAAKLLDAARDVPKERQVRYQLKIGNKDKAAQLATQLPNDAPGTCLRADALFQCGKSDEAKKQFESARTVASSLDAGLAIALRMDTLAKEFGAGDHWRKPREPRKDSGVRPEMTTLGPLQWHPWRSKDFSLEDEAGKVVALHDFKGKPTVVLFYLGHTCGHCMEQLKAFSNSAEEFGKAGINLIAIGSETVADLASTREECGGRKDLSSPITLLADPGWKSFREWRCYDDFEGLGMHGAFLLDGSGAVRWADVSYEPFKDIRFLLNESKRLLKFAPAK